MTDHPDMYDVNHAIEREASRLRGRIADEEAARRAVADELREELAELRRNLRDLGERIDD